MTGSEMSHARGRGAANPPEVSASKESIDSSDLPETTASARTSSMAVGELGAREPVAKEGQRGPGMFVHAPTPAIHGRSPSFRNRPARPHQRAAVLAGRVDADPALGVNDAPAEDDRGDVTLAGCA